MEDRLRSALNALSAAASLWALTAPPAHAQVTETVLYSFLGGADGASSYAALIADEKGALYGTTVYGGISNSVCFGPCGVVFKLTPRPVRQPPWSETTLWSFSGGNDGASPFGGLFARNESPSWKKPLYGTTSFNGAFGNGTVFNLTDGTLTTLWSFTGGADGANPFAAMIADEKTGTLYGTTEGGGASGNGTVFKIDTIDQTLTTIYSFSGSPDGAAPAGSLLADEAGALYGTTFAGGVSGKGVVFKLTPPDRGETAWSETVLWAFTGGRDGSSPLAGLIADKSGTLYGTTELGGASGGGVVFSLTPPARGQTAWTETVLYSFCSQPNCSDGGGPSAPLIADRNGALYGTAGGGGINFSGTVFKLTPPAGGQTTWTGTTLYQFSGGADGGSPYAGLTADNKGALYSTTVFGGNTIACGVYGCGVVFKLTGTGFAPGEVQAGD